MTERGGDHGPDRPLPADTLLEHGNWLLGATLPTKPHLTRGTNTSSIHPHLPSEVCQVLWLDVCGGFGFNFLFLFLKMRTDVPNSTIPGKD